MQQYQAKIINAATGTTTSAAIDASNMYSISVQGISTGTLAGTIAVNASNDTPIGNKGFSSSTWTPTNWTAIPSATATLTAGGTALIPTLDTCYQFIQVVFTATGGTGSATVQIKVIGV